MSALEIPFLTALDTRAAVKGSRDPLGIQGIWTRFGRHVVGNLTTVSNSLRDFTTTLLGYHFAQVVAEEAGPGSELGTFLKWEQLAAYARASANRDFLFRGTEKVAAALNEGDPITISADRTFHILGNQKIYGLWGLYTVASRESGFLSGDPPRLTPRARAFCEEQYFDALPMERIVDILTAAKSRLDWQGRDESLFRDVGKVLRLKLSSAERSFYREHLLEGGPTDKTQGRQRQLAELIVRTFNDDFSWSPQVMQALAKEARTRGEEWAPLATCLDRIRVCESVLAPMSSLFTFLLGMDGRSVDTAIVRLKDRWREGLGFINPDEFEELAGEIGDGDADTGARWVDIARAASSGSYGQLIELASEQNREVMKARGGAAWCEVREGKLVVRFRDEEGKLPTVAEAKKMWRFPYFIDSLRSVGIALDTK